MKVVLLSLFVLMGTIGFSQIHGQVKIDKRGVEKDISYDLTASSQEGLLILNIVVNRDGLVTSVTLDSERSNVTHIILAREAKMRAKKLKFKPCYECPQYHKGILEFKVVKKG